MVDVVAAHTGMVVAKAVMLAADWLVAVMEERVERAARVARMRIVGINRPGPDLRTLPTHLHQYSH